MSNTTAADVKRLRQLTGAGMLDCKNALTESGGDFDKAVEILRLKGAKDVHKRAERTAGNGLVTALHEGTGRAVLLELNCETDFVAKTDRFQQAAAQIAEFVLSSGPADVPTLLGAEITPGTTVAKLIEETSAAIGEKVELRRFALFENGYVASYLHKSDPQLPPTVGVLVALDRPEQAVARDLAQQIAAMAPRYLRREDVPEDLVATERRLAEQMARDEGKPEQALPRIVEGRVNGFFKEVTLLEQPFVKDNKKTIKQVLAEAGVAVDRFARFRVGQS